MTSIMERVQQTEALALYFTGPDCGVCSVFLPKLQALLAEEFPLLQLEVIRIQDHPAWAGQLSVFTVPTLLVFFDGQEVLRQAQLLSVHQVREGLGRIYGLRFLN